MSASSMPSQVVKDSASEASAGSQTKKSSAASGMPMMTVRKIRSPRPRLRARLRIVRGEGREDTVRETFPVLVRP